MLVQQVRGGDQREAGLARAAAAGERHEPLPLHQQCGAQALELVLPPDQRRRARRQVGRTGLVGAGRRERRRAATVDDRAEQRLRRGEVLQAMGAQRLDGRRVADEGARGGGQQQLAAVRGGRDPRRAVDLQPEIAGRVALHVPDVQAHPHAQLADLRRPRMGPQRPQRRDGGARAAAASANVAKKASPSVRSTKPPSAAIAPPISAWWALSTSGQRLPSSDASRVEPSMSVNSRAIVPVGACVAGSTRQA